MVALLRSAPSRPVTATNVVRRAQAQRQERVVEGRRAERHRLALQTWLCTDEGSQRGYILEISAGGARVGGVGTRLKPGARFLAKIVLDPREPPLLLRAEAVRFAPVPASDRWACPELCIRFLDTGGKDGLTAMGLAEQERLEDYLAALRPRGPKSV